MKSKEEPKTRDPRPETQESGELSGLRWMALSAFFFSLMALQVKLVGSRIPNQQVVLVRSLITLGLTALALSRAGVNPWGNNRSLLFLRGLSGFGALSCFFYAIAHLPLAEATVIHFTHPVFTALLATVFLAESMDRVLLLGTGASLAGVTLIARPGFLFGSGTQLELATLGIALTGSLLTAAAYVSVRKLARTEHHLVTILYFPLVSVPAASLTALPNWVWPTPLEWVWLVGAGLATQLGQVFLTRGLYQASAGPATAVGYLQLVFAAVWGFTFFAEVPGLGTVLGTLLIVGSTLMIARHRSRRRVPAATG